MNRDKNPEAGKKQSEGILDRAFNKFLNLGERKIWFISWEGHSHFVQRALQFLCHLWPKEC